MFAEKGEIASGIVYVNVAHERYSYRAGRVDLDLDQFAGIFRRAAFLVLLLALFPKLVGVEFFVGDFRDLKRERLCPVERPVRL